MSDHDFTQENLEASVAGGLTADERATLERHVADCAECTQALTSARKLEQSMHTLFADAPPDANLEERAIARLRRRPVGYPVWVRYVMGAAAVLVLALVGSVVQAVVADGGKRFKEAMSGPELRNHLKIVGGRSYRASLEGDHLEGKPFANFDIDPAAKEFDTDIQYKKERLADVSVPGSNAPAGVLLIDDSRSMGKPDGSGQDLLSGLTSSGTLTPDKFGWNGVVSKHKPTDYVTLPDSDEGKRQANFDGRTGATHENALRFGAGEKKGPQPAQQDFQMLSPTGVSANLGYFKPGSDTAKPNDPMTPPPPSGGGSSRITIREKDKAAETIAKLEQEKKNDGQPKDGPPPLQPEPIGRKIIRTGDMEFEVESFDSAVSTINKLIDAVKGAFVATTNSDKLPNGKMKGAVVVRMPPVALDKFILDLRGALKNGELKSQRIGSADVTKQYTDIESRFKAARTMEERLLKIIQNGKGEVKDLIAAERELGIWRTKIEEMQGEINYYNNQVSLSTLTINLSEKELSMPFALVTSEKVQMRIEVEEVNKALSTAAAAAVKQFKGRITKSEAKQHKAGQYEAFLQAEIPPAESLPFRAQIRTLGILIEDEATRKTQAEGGSGKPGKTETRENDVTFEISLNNNANIAPRRFVKIDIAAADVAASFTKIEEAILRMKGQIRVSNKQEPDRQRITATFEFNVPIDKKAEFDKLLADVGPVLNKTNHQTPVTEIASEQKFGYVVNLYSPATIAPREKVMLTIEVRDVAAAAAQIEKAGKDVKGQVERGRFVQNPAGKVSTVVAMRVPLASNDLLVGQFIGMANKVLEREQTPSSQSPENELSTAVIFVNVTGGSKIVPDDQDLGSQFSKALGWAFWVFCWCMIFIISGLAFIVPWVVVIWVAVKLIGWMWGRKPTNEVAVKPVTPKAETPAPKTESGEQKPTNS